MRLRVLFIDIACVVLGFGAAVAALPRAEACSPTSPAAAAVASAHAGGR